MKRCVVWLSLMLLGLVGGARAQRAGSTVQLPTFSHFSSGTTVWVPDRGGAYLGGVRRAASGRVGFGTPMLPARTSTKVSGSVRSASSVHVTVTVHDFAAMDEYLLSRKTPFSQSLQSAQSPAATTALAPTGRPQNPQGGLARKPPSRTGFGDPPPMRVTTAERLRRRRQPAQVVGAADFFQRGRQAEAFGKTSVAKAYYQLAARRATGELKQRVQSRLDALQ